MIGIIYYIKGDLEKTLEHYQRALTIQERDAPNSLIVAVSYGNIGNVYYGKGRDSEKALEHYQSALVIRERDAPDSLILARSHTNIGNVCFDKGDMEKALEHYQHGCTDYSRVTRAKFADGGNIPQQYWNFIFLKGVILTRLCGALPSCLGAKRERDTPNSLAVASMKKRIGKIYAAR
jgi:tetratricopeptide (TPR) repeat protein